MIAELGHYALMLALGLALIQGVMPIVGTRSNDPVLMSMAAPTALAQFCFRRPGVWRARRLLRHVRFLGTQRLREFEFGDAADLPAHQRLGQPRRLDDAVGLHPYVVRRAGRGLRHQFADQAQSQCARRAGLDRRRLSSFHSHHLESVPAHRRRAVRGPRPQSGPARSRPRLPSAASLSRLCRLLDRLFVRNRGVARRPYRCRLGTVRAPVGARRMDVPDARHRRRLVLGLLRARLGRLLVLGSGGKCLADAVACRHGTAAFRGGDGKARRTQSLDHPARHRCLFAVADRHFSGALGRADFGPRIRQRSEARHFHSGHPGHVHWRRAGALRLARAAPEAGRTVCADLARRRARLQQSISDRAPAPPFSSARSIRSRSKP